MLVLVTNPEVDSLTRYLHTWTKRLVKTCKHPHSFLHLEGSKVVRENVGKFLQKRGIELALFNGHGSDDVIAGDENLPILTVDDVHLLSGVAVHVLSCNTAKTLGPLAMKKGAKSYIGYDAQFVAVLKDGYLSNPLEDDTAALFLNPAFAVPKALLDGKTAEEAVEIGRQAYNQSIIKVFNSDVQSDNDQFVKLLFWDRNHLKRC